MKIQTLVALSALMSSTAGCANQVPAQTETREARLQTVKRAPSSDAPLTTAKKLFLDVHDLGPGKVTAQAVAAAHEKDRAAQAKYGVDFKAYWLDEKQGKIYCLAEAPSAAAANAVHQEAHGLLAKEITEVTADNGNWRPTPQSRLFLDFHHFGAGKVTAEGVAAAHAKDVAVGPKYGVRYLNYWFDQRTGTVVCLSEAPDAAAAVAVHQEAHGLVPDAIEEVSEGR